MPLEIVRPNALKEMILSANGHALHLSSLELARAKLNWPVRSQFPPPQIIRSCANELFIISENPPEGYEIDEIPGEYFSVAIHKVRK
jgi:hypothetical protein